MDRDEAIARIRKALKARTGRAWSVTGGRDTEWGWITVTSPPRRRVRGCLTDADRTELTAVLGLPAPIHCQGFSIPAGDDYYRHFVERAETGSSAVRVRQLYWD